MRGVKPLLTSSRSFVCFGGSIISIIMPLLLELLLGRLLVERDAASSLEVGQSWLIVTRSVVAW